MLELCYHILIYIKTRGLLMRYNQVCAYSNIRHPLTYNAYNKRGRMEVSEGCMVGKLGDGETQQMNDHQNEGATIGGKRRERGKLAKSWRARWERLRRSRMGGHLQSLFFWFSIYHYGRHSRLLCSFFCGSFAVFFAFVALLRLARVGYGLRQKLLAFEYAAFRLHAQLRAFA